MSAVGPDGRPTLATGPDDAAPQTAAIEAVPALVIGAGPAGLMAADVLSAAGHGVLLAEAMPSPARKLLMAGKSGLNLTKDEPPAAFRAALHRTGSVTLPEMNPAEVVAFAESLGQPTFTGSTGRVFPVAMKASPLLRAWLRRLEAQGVTLRSHWRWTGWDGDAFRFDTPEGVRLVRPRVAVLALGGASWPRLGSDGAWTGTLAAEGVRLAPLRPANMGFRVDWSPAMAALFGRPVKGTALRAGALSSRGEWVITAAGIEGGAVYEIASALRDGAAGTVDLAPDLTPAELARRFARPRGRLSLGNWLRRCLPDPVKVALLLEWGRPLPGDPAGWADLTKGLPLRHEGPMAIETAISSAGGVTWDSVTKAQELRALPDVFVAGEMLDWEAPTGGYLLTACLGSGLHAGRAAAARLASMAAG